MRRAAALTLVVALLLVAGCVGPTRSIAFGAGNADGTTGSFFVTVDIVFRSGYTSTIKYPQEWIVKDPPFNHFYAATPGSILHMSITVVPAERAQRVSCAISVDGRAVDAGQGGFPRGIVCIGPPL